MVLRAGYHRPDVPSGRQFQGDFRLWVDLCAPGPEHRLFSHISMNWAGQPLTSHEVAVNLIAGTTTRTGLTVRDARLSVLFISRP
jgi:hypothetical protein